MSIAGGATVIISISFTIILWSLKTGQPWAASTHNLKSSFSVLLSNSALAQYR